MQSQIKTDKETVKTLCDVFFVPFPSVFICGYNDR